MFVKIVFCRHNLDDLIAARAIIAIQARYFYITFLLIAAENRPSF